jgi:hypothetical protein
MKPPTTDDLRNLTGVPSTQQPLITEQEFSIEEAKSPRPVWTKPLPKLAVAGILLTPVFILAASFLVGGGHSESSSQTLDTAQAKPKPEQTIDPAAQMQRENARLKSTAALEGQQNLEKQLAKQPNEKPIKVVQKQPSSLAKSSSVQPKEDTETVAIPATSPSMATAPGPRPALVSDRPSEPIPSSYAPSRSPTETIDPEQRWRQLARLGSYGSIQPESSTVPEWSSAQKSAPDGQSATAPAASLEGSVPTAQITPTSAVQTDSSTVLVSNSNRDVIVPTVEMNREPTAITPLETTHPAILQDAEARILNGSSRQPTALIAGTTVSGVLITPLVWDEAKENNRFTVVLSQPIKDARGQTVLPANTQLLVQIESVSPTGSVQLSAQTATWQQAGMTKEIALPQGAIQIRGENGSPLMAQQFTDKGKEIAAMDRGQFLLGAIRGASEQFTQSNTSVQTGNGSTIVTQQNQQPNGIAGALKGGIDVILETIAQRNQRAVEEIQQRPPIRYIEAGRRVQIFVNQSMQLPI